MPIAKPLGGTIVRIAVCRVCEEQIYWLDGIWVHSYTGWSGCGTSSASVSEEK